MGANASARPLLDYEEAVERLGDAQISKIREGFARLAVRDGHLGRAEFRTGFLNTIAGVPVPEDLAGALFNAFDSNASGLITEEEFICGLAILHRGRPVEKLRLLFSVYDADRDKRLSDRDLKRFAHALDDGQVGATRDQAVQDALAALRAKGPSVGFEHFEQWANKHMNSPLIQWVNFYRDLNPQGVAQLTSAFERMRPMERSHSMDARDVQEEVASLCESLGIDEDLAKDIREEWQKIIDKSHLGVVDVEAFVVAFSSLHYLLVKRLFRVMDSSKNCTLSLQEWAAGLRVCMQGSDDDRARFCFELFAEPPPPPPTAVAAAAAAEDASGAAVVGAAVAGASAADVAPPLPPPLVVPPEAVRQLCRFVDGSIASFAASPYRKRQLEVATPPSDDDGGLTLQQFLAEPWASRASELVRSIGRLARVDLALLPKDPKEERDIVDWLNADFDPQNPGRPGDTWYLISARWWEQWCECKGEALHINNYELLHQSSLSRVRMGLNHCEDYQLVTEGAWRALHAWYGGPGPPLPRQVIQVDGRCELEIYPLCLHVSRTDDNGKELLADEVMVISRSRLLKEVKEQACALHRFPEPVAVFHKMTLRDEDEWEAGDESKTLHELGFIDEHRLQLRKKSKLRESPLSPAGANSAKGKSNAVGLQNLGNTCYMNASLQCLLNTPMLPLYFEHQYCYDMNLNGSWGMSGKLAVAFSELLAEVERQRNGAGVVAPRSFRRTVGDFKSQFGGFRQQDAQEFLSIFLAGLSDDVNRTHEKPYIELKDSEGRPDQVVADEFWAAHCHREQSAVAALFSSQFKSIARCKDCGHENATFDPFSFLPIPLPEHNFRWVTCTVVSAPQSGNFDQHTVQVCARVPKRGQLSDVLCGAAGLTGLPAEELVAADVASGYVNRLLDSTAAMSTLSDDARPTVFHVPAPLAAVPMPTPTPPPPSSEAEEGREPIPSERVQADGPRQNQETVMVYLVQRRLQKVERYFLNPYAPELFGTPILLRLPLTCSGLELYTSVFGCVKHVVPDFIPDPNARAGPRYPFSLSLVKRDGSACSKCSWREGCLGCRVYPKSNEPVQLRAEATLGIDWDAKVLDKHYKVKIARHVHMHESVKLAQLERNTPENLGQCLESLTQEEEVLMYCKDCTKKKGEYTETVHTKGFKIWSCGPLLVMQLKRFHSGDGASYKLHNLITFPTHLDMGEYLAGEAEGSGCSTDAAGGTEPGENEKDREPAVKTARGDQNSKAATNESQTFRTLSREITQYELYGVVNHIGGMGSGHYTSFVRRGDGSSGSRTKWYCCNDERVYEVSEEDVVSMNAYLLFYVRTDVASGSIALKDLYPPRATSSDQAVKPEEVKKRSWAPSLLKSTFSSGGGNTSSQDSGFCGVM